MASQPTNYHKKPSGPPRRYVVTYEEDCHGGNVMTFSVYANLASEATARVIDYIKTNRLHDSYYGYTLYPAFGTQQVDHEIK